MLFELSAGQAFHLRLEIVDDGTTHSLVGVLRARVVRIHAILDLRHGKRLLGLIQDSEDRVVQGLRALLVGLAGRATQGVEVHGRGGLRAGGGGFILGLGL